MQLEGKHQIDNSNGDINPFTFRKTPSDEHNNLVNVATIDIYDKSERKNTYPKLTCENKHLLSNESWRKISISKVSIAEYIISSNKLKHIISVLTLIM